MTSSLVSISTGNRETRWRNAFLLAASLTVLVFGGLLLQGSSGWASSGMLLALGLLLVCTVLLGGWLRNPIPRAATEQPARRGAVALMALAALVVLFGLRAALDKSLLFLLPVLGLLILLVLKQPVPRREVAYALVLALVAGVAGLGAGWITYISNVEWALLQVALVLTGFLAGWGMLRSGGLDRSGVGRSRWLSQGTASAVRGFLAGLLLGLPWALGIVLMGGAAGDRQAWVSAWWQPFTAIQPGIAEEAWGRALLVPLLFLFLRRAASARAAFGLALVIVAFWFAYLHQPNGFDPSILTGTLITGALFALPVSFLFFYRDLETAIGFHFVQDFIKFACALLLASQS